MTGQTLVSVLQGSPSSPAIVVGSNGPTLTRGQLLALAEQFAQSLRESGIRPGDVVTIVDANTVRRRGGVWSASRAGLLSFTAPVPVPGEL